MLAHTWSVLTPGLFYPESLTESPADLYYFNLHLAKALFASPHHYYTTQVETDRVRVGCEFCSVL